MLTQISIFLYMCMNYIHVTMWYIYIIYGICVIYIKIYNMYGLYIGTIFIYTADIYMDAVYIYIYIYIYIVYYVIYMSMYYI